MLNITKNPITLSVIVQNAVMLNVVMPSVVYAESHKLNAVMLSVTDNLTHSLTMLDVKKCGPMSLKADIYLTRANGPSGTRAFTYNNAG
jgi:hypothetical protein